MISTDFHDPELPQDEMAALTTQMRAVTRRLSRDQILDLADVLHEIIRERQLEVPRGGGCTTGSMLSQIGKRSTRPPSVLQQAKRQAFQFARRFCAALHLARKVPGPRGTSALAGLMGETRGLLACHDCLEEAP